MQYHNFSKTILAVAAVTLSAIAGIVYIVDPFCQFHLPWFGLEAIFNRGTQSYSNPGLAKNCDYDSVLLGSSVSENFRASWFDEAFGCETLKLPYAGAWSGTYAKIMDVVFDTHQVRNMFFSTDQFAFQNDASRPRYELPEYLYDNNPFNDVKYLLNKEVFPEIIDMLRYSKQEKTIAFDDAYSWQDSHVFSEERVLLQYKRPETSSVKRRKDHFFPAAEKNLENILPFIEGHPETTFYFFFPPYSILWWDLNRQAGTLDAVLEMTEYLIDRLLQYENVQVFYFQNEADIINDLNNYRESMHFSREINQWMAQCIAEGSHRVYPGEVSHILQDMKNQTLAFDYEERFGRS